MHRSLALICLIVALSIGGCGKEPADRAPAEQPAAAVQKAEEDRAPAAQPADRPAETAVQPGEKPPEETAAAPAETVTETEDREAAEGAANAPVQPALRLGSLPASAPASRFAVGTHYQVLVPAQPTNVAPGKVEVVEVFWYGCTQCHDLETAIESWRGKGKAAYVEFLRVPAMWNESTRMYARVFYTAEVLGKLDELHSLIFREVQSGADPLNTVARIETFFKRHGVGADEFNKTFTGFDVEAKLQRAEFLNQRYRVDSAPLVVVNGKYTTSVSSAGGERNLFALINELAAHEHGG